MVATFKIGLLSKEERTNPMHLSGSQTSFHLVIHTTEMKFLAITHPSYRARENINTLTKFVWEFSLELA